LNLDEDVFKYLKDMIMIPSFSLEEKELARYVGGKLTDFGLRTTFQYISDKSENVIASWEGNKRTPIVIMAGHLDTVSPVAGWNTDPFTPHEAGDRIYGLGSCDMKGGIAVILAIAKAVATKSVPFEGSLSVVLVADEEGYSSGIKKAIESGLKADVAFMVEPHFYSVVVGAVGKVLVLGDVQGKAGHASDPSSGINAIEETAKFISNLQYLKLPAYPNFNPQPYVTLNIKGGYERYSVTIPDNCHFSLNKHLVPGETKENVIEQLKKSASDLNLIADFRFKIGEPFYPPYVVNKDLFYINFLKDIYKNIVGQDLELEYSSGVSDSNCLVGFAGIDTIEFGPSGDGMHSANEWVSKTQILKSIQIYSNVLSKIS